MYALTRRRSTIKPRHVSALNPIRSLLEILASVLPGILGMIPIASLALIHARLALRTAHVILVRKVIY